MNRLIAIAILLWSGDALAHTCAEVVDSDLRQGVTVTGKLVVKADLTETDTIYTASVLDPSIATISPATHTAHDGIFSFTGVRTGTTSATIHWDYPPTMAQGDCIVPITVVFNPDDLNNIPTDGSQGVDPPGCGCNATTPPQSRSWLWLSSLLLVFLARRSRP